MCASLIHHIYLYTASYPYRGEMCTALTTIADCQDSSQSLLSTLSTSLLSAYSPFEVYSAPNKANCSQTLSKVTAMARRGYIKGSMGTSLLMVDLVSLYMASAPSLSSKGRRILVATEGSEVTSAVSGLKIFCCLSPSTNRALPHTSHVS